MIHRCVWSEGSQVYMDYHDKEWGTPLHDDRLLFEFLILEGAQAGLSWITILKKRENYKKAFDEFDPVKIAAYNTDKINELLLNEGIIRNRRKIEAAVQNAKTFLNVKEVFGSFDEYIWQFTNGKTIVNKWKTVKEIPPKTVESNRMSKDLVKHGFKFVGSTICYAFMQAVGMVNDHVVECFRYDEINKKLRQVNDSYRVGLAN